MGRPVTKNELIEVAQNNFDQLWALIQTLSDKERQTPFDFSQDEKKKEAHWKRDKNLKDVLIHLYEWHQLLLTWVARNQAGKHQQFLPEPYNWKTYGDLNILFWQNHHKTSYQEAKQMLIKSHNDVMGVINQFSNDQLFNKDTFAWTGTTSLGSYCVSATASHYDWAIKKIKAHKKILNEYVS